MTDDKPKHEHEHDEAKPLDEAELNKDLEIKDDKDADAVKGGMNFQKITYSD